MHRTRASRPKARIGSGHSLRRRIHPGSVGRVELRVAIGWAIGRSNGDGLLHVGVEHVVDPRRSQLGHLRAGRDAQHLLQRKHALLGGRKCYGLVLPIIAPHASIVQQPDRGLARQEQPLHLPGKVHHLHRPQRLERLVGRIWILHPAAIELAQQHEVRLRQRVDHNVLGPALPVVAAVGEVLPRQRRRVAAIRPVGETGGARKDAHASDLVGHGIGEHLRQVWDQLRVQPLHHQALDRRLPHLVRVAVQHVVDRRVTGGGLQLRDERKCGV